MFGRIIDWLLGIERKPQSYPYHRHRAWEEREEVGPDYLHPRDIRIGRVPERIANYKPIIRIGYGYGFGMRQVEAWLHPIQDRQRKLAELRERKQRMLPELRRRAERRRELRETWGWMDLSIQEVMELWPRSGVASV